LADVCGLITSALIVGDGVFPSMNERLTYLLTYLLTYSLSYLLTFLLYISAVSGRDIVTLYFVRS